MWKDMAITCATDLHAVLCCSSIPRAAASLSRLLLPVVSSRHTGVSQLAAYD